MTRERKRALSRRGFAAVLAAPAFGQTPAAAPADDLEAARQALRSTFGQMAKTEVPMATEPAFLFKVQ